MDNADVANGSLLIERIDSYSDRVRKRAAPCAMSEGTQPRTLGYLALPRLLVQDRWIRLFSKSHFRLEMYGHNGLTIIEQLLT